MKIELTEEQMIALGGAQVSTLEKQVSDLKQANARLQGEIKALREMAYDGGIPNLLWSERAKEAEAIINEFSTRLELWYQK